MSVIPINSINQAYSAKKNSVAFGDAIHQPKTTQVNNENKSSAAVPILAGIGGAATITYLWKKFGKKNNAVNEIITPEALKSIQEQVAKNYSNFIKALKNIR